MAPPGRLLRSCVIAIVEEYAHLFRPGQRVLEIGCGAWSPLKEQGRALGYQWEGIDVNSNHMGKPTIATQLASVESIPFPDAHFDFVVATQSMEHWEEYCVHLRKGLSELFRVLQPGGWALVNVPIHFHGGPLFVSGNLRRLRSLFEPFADEIRFERWRNPPTPLPAVRQTLRHYWFKPSLWGKSSYVLDIRVKRKAQVEYFNCRRLGILTKIRRALIDRTPLYYLTVTGFRILETFRRGRTRTHRKTR